MLMFGIVYRQDRILLSEGNSEERIKYTVMKVEQLTHRQQWVSSTKMSQMPPGCRPNVEVRMIVLARDSATRTTKRTLRQSNIVLDLPQSAHVRRSSNTGSCIRIYMLDSVVLPLMIPPQSTPIHTSARTHGKQLARQSTQIQRHNDWYTYNW